MTPNENNSRGGNLLREVENIMQTVRPILREEAQKRDFHNYLIDMKEEIKEPIPVLSLDGMTICSEGNISTIVGEAKSKKTFLCSALVAGFLHRYKKPVLGSDPHPDEMVLWVDTEQSRSHVQQLNKRILDLSKWDNFCNHKYLRMLALREIEPKLRSKMLFEAIEEWKPRLVVIDGISDLLYNTNDLEESESLVTMLMRTSSRLKNHILVVLHTNPNSDKARGHIGSALQRKSESVIYVRKMGDCSIVEPQFCRNEPFDRFAFRINAEGMPETCPMPEVVNTNNSQYMNIITELMLEMNGCCPREILTTKLCQRLECSKRAASMRILRALRDGVIMERTYLKDKKELALVGGNAVTR